MSVTSTAGKITSTSSEIAAEGGNTVLSQALTMDLDKDFVNSMVGATNKLSLISDADVVGTEQKFPQAPAILMNTMIFSH